jgi:hypothetical protein
MQARLDRMLAYVQDTLDSQHPSAGAVGNLMAIRDEIDAITLALPSGAEPVGYVLPQHLENRVFQFTAYCVRSVAEAHAPQGSAVALYAAPQSSSQVTEERFPVTLGKVHEAIDGYVQALVDRKHGGVALDHAFGAICDALGRSTTAELDARRAALSPVKGDGQ